MQFIRKSQGHSWLPMIGGAVAALVLATATAAQQVNQHRQVRLVIPDDMPAFDPAVRERDERAIVPRALVFPSGPEEEKISVVLLNPRHADVGTLATALSLLARALGDRRTEILVVTSLEPHDSDGLEMAKATRDLVNLKASTKRKVPKLHGVGQVMEVAVDLEAWRSGGGE